MADYNYTISPLRIDALEQEIADAALAANLTGTVAKGDQVTISFDAALSAGDEATLTAVVVNHTAPPPKPGDTVCLLKDGVDDPAVVANGAQIYVEGGYLKVKFGSGNVVSLAQDA